MKQKHILQHITAFIIIFLCFAFIQVKINPFEWSKTSRTLLLVAYGIFEIFEAISNLDEKKS